MAEVQYSGDYVCIGHSYLGEVFTYKEYRTDLDEHVFTDSDGDELHVPTSDIGCMVRKPQVGDWYRVHPTEKTWGVVFVGERKVRINEIGNGDSTDSVLLISFCKRISKGEIVLLPKKEDTTIVVEETPQWYRMSVVDGRPVGKWDKISREKVEKTLIGNGYDKQFDHIHQFTAHLNQLEQITQPIVLQYAAYAYGKLSEIKQIDLLGG